VEETAAAIARAAGRRDLSGRIGFLCDPHPVTVAELASAIAAGADRPVRMLEIPDAVVRAAGAVETLREKITRVSRPFNADKAREILAGDWLCDPVPMRGELGLPPPVPLDEGLRAAWSWYRERRWI